MCHLRFSSVYCLCAEGREEKQTKWVWEKTNAILRRTLQEDSSQTPKVCTIMDQETCSDLKGAD